MPIAPEVDPEGADLERQRHQHDEQHQRHQLGQRDHCVEHGGTADAAQHQCMDHPQNERRAANGGSRVAISKSRKEIPQGTERSHQVAHVADPGTDPVTPGRVEADVLSGKGLCVGIHTVVQLGFAQGKRLVHQRQHQHAHAADEPADQYGAGTGTRRHVLRQSEDATAQYRPDHQGDEQAETQGSRRFKRGHFGGIHVG